MVLASSASSTNEPSSSSSASRSRTNSLSCAASLSPSFVRGCPRAPARSAGELLGDAVRVAVARSSRSRRRPRHVRRMARMAMSSVSGALAKSRAASSSVLAQHVGGRRPGRAAGRWRCAPRRTAARRRGPRPGRRCRAAAGRRRPARSRGCSSVPRRVEHAAAVRWPAAAAPRGRATARPPGGRPRRSAACRPRCRTRPRRSEMNSSRPAGRRHLRVELLERLGRVAVLRAGTPAAGTWPGRR